MPSRIKFFLLISLILIISGNFKASFSQTTYTSIQSGNWTSGSTWDLGSSPGINDHAIIANGTTVTNNVNGAQGARIQNLTIDAGGILNGDNRITRVSGNLTVNGTYTSKVAAGSDLILTGGVLDGLGNIIINGTGAYFRINSNLSVSSSADLFISGPVNIGSAVTVTNNGAVEISGDMVGTNATTSIWTNSNDSYLTINGVLLLNGILSASSTGNTVSYNNTGLQTVKSPSSNTYYNLNISGSGNKNMGSDLILAGNMEINNSPTLVSNNYNINVAGNWTNESLFDEGTGDVIFSGASDQTITNSTIETFYRLIVNKSGGNLVLANDVVASNTLQLSGGNVQTGSNKLTLGTSTVSVGTLNPISGYINGKFERWINSTGTVIFPVGSSSQKTIYFTLNGLNSGGSVISEFIENDPGNNGLPLVDGTITIHNTFVEGYWTLSELNGFNLGGANTFDLSLDGNGLTSFPINAATRILSRPNSGSSWVTDGTHLDATGSLVNRVGLGTLPAEFALGDSTNCSRPIASAITGAIEVDISQTGVSYSVINNPPNTYSWTIFGGSQASGTNTNSITVNWGATGMDNAYVQVVESNTCTNSAPVLLPVTIHSVAPISITGRSSISENTNGVTYSVPLQSGYLYYWTITGGSQASGGNTNSITIDWGSAGLGTVSVVAQKPGYTAAPAENLNVNKYVIIESINSGSWSSTGTWDCGCIPLPTENVRINGGHSVTLPNGQPREINNLIIEINGDLDSRNRNFYIYGDFTNNGTYWGNGSNTLYLDGVDKIIDGIGTISEDVDITSGDKTIAPTAVLSLTTSNLTLGSSVTIVNEGSISIGGNLLDADATSKWINSTNSNLEVSGTLMTSNGVLDATATGNTVVYNGAAAQNIKDPLSSTYYNISFDQAGTKTMVSNLTVLGNLTILNGSLDVSAANNYSINLGGDFSLLGGSFLQQSGTVTFDGTADQTTTGILSFNNLTANKLSGSILLNSNVNIGSTGTLTMNSGNIFTQGNILQIGTAAGAGTEGTLVHSAGTVIGQIQRWAGSTGTDYLFPIGTASSYRPAIVNFTNLNGGALIAEFIAADPGSAGLPLVDVATTVTNQFTDGYWDFSVAGGLTTTDYNLELLAQDFTSRQVNINTRILKRTNAGNWTFDGTHVDASNPSVYRNNLTGGITTSTQFGLGFVCAPFTVSEFITNVTCFGGSNGEINLTVSDGTAPYSFVWTNSETTEDISGLTAGGYGVTVTDANGCITNGLYSVTQPAAISISESVTNVTCNGGNNGEIDITISGGTAPFNILWSTIDGSGVVTTDEDQTGLTAGTYTVLIQDVNGCIGTKDIVVTEPLSLAGSISSQTNVACFGDATGTVTVAGSDGTAPYEYSIDGGATYQASGTFGTLSANNYTITVRDAALCTFDIAVTITQPATALSGGISSQINVACFGGANGSVTVAGSDGTAPYEYSIDGGTTYQASGTFAGLSANNYTVRVRDAGLCTFDVAVIITEPAVALSGSITAQTNVACFGDATGSVTVIGTDGTPPYQFTIDGGTTYQGAGTFNSLSANNYTVTIRDANLCTFDVAVNISQPGSPLSGSIGSQTNVSCFGDASGSVTINGSGGTPGYLYSIDGGTTYQGSGTFGSLSANNYTVRIQDTNLCTFDVALNITQPATALTGSISAQTNVACFGGADGSVTIAGSGGTAPYQYSINGGSTYQVSGTFTGLSANNYTVRIRDNNSCIYDVAVTITQPATALSGNIDSQTNVACFGDASGSVSVSGLGGTSPYTYSLDGAPYQASGTYSGLTAQSYLVIVRDLNGCIYNVNITITQPAAPLTGSISSQSNVACFGDATGIVTVAGSDGTAPYEYSIDGGTTYQASGTFRFPVSEQLYSQSKRCRPMYL